MRRRLLAAAGALALYLFGYQAGYRMGYLEGGLAGSLQWFRTSLRARS